jgi:hypothetical protein
MLKRKAEDRREFAKLPAAEAQRLISIHLEGRLPASTDGDPLFASDLTGNAFLE